MSAGDVDGAVARLRLRRRASPTPLSAIQLHARRGPVRDAGPTRTGSEASSVRCITCEARGTSKSIPSTNWAVRKRASELPRASRDRRACAAHSGDGGRGPRRRLARSNIRDAPAALGGHREYRGGASRNGQVPLPCVAPLSAWVVMVVTDVYMHLTGQGKGAFRDLRPHRNRLAQQGEVIGPAASLPASSVFNHLDRK